MCKDVIRPVVMHLLIVFPYLLLSALQTNADRVNYESRDLTWVPSASGRDVVEATIQKIKTFSDIAQDFSLLRRYALMESTFGEDKERMDANPGGGIWQIDADVHNLSSILLVNQLIATVVDRMEEVFNIECLFCGYNFSTPMVSGLAVQAFNQYKYGPNTPGDVTRQSDAWVDDYHPGADAANYSQIINAFKAEEDKFCDDDFKLDLWILLDDSEDITDEEFESQLNFTSALASKFTVSHTKIQIGFSVLSNNEHEVHFWFNESDSLSALKTAVSDTKRNKLNLQTDEALKDIVNNRFDTSNGGRPTPDKDLRRVIVVITEEKISEDVETASQDVEDSNTSVIVLAVCSSCNETRLNLLATDPDDDHVLTFSDFSTFAQNESRTKARKQICDTVFAHSVYSYIENSLIENPSAYSDHNSLITDVENQFSLSCFDCGDSISSSLTSTLSDIFDASKVISGVNSKMLKRELITWSSEHNDEDCSADLKMDLWFLLNGKSSDIDFTTQTTFVADMVTEFTISATKVQVGLSVTHFNRYEVYFNLDQYSTVGELETNIRDAKHPIHWRETGKALQDILDRGFTEEAGSRPLTSFVPRTVIIVTNGRNNINYSAPGKNMHEANISVYGASMGNYVNDTEIEAMLSPPLRKHSYHLYEFNKLEDYFIPEVYTSLCRSPIPVTAVNQIQLTLKQNIERYLFTKVLEDKDLKISFQISEQGTSGNAYVSVAVTEPNSVYFDISIDLKKGTTNILVKASELVAKHKGRIQGIEKWIVRDGAIAIYITLVSTGPTMSVIASVKPLAQGSSIPVNVEEDDIAATTTAAVEQASVQNNGDTSNNNQADSATTTSTNGNSISQQQNVDTNNASNGDGSDGTGSDGTGSDGTGSDGTGSDGTGSDGTGSDGTGSDGTGSDGNGSDGNGSDGNGSDGNGSDGNGSDNNPSTTRTDVSVSLHSQAVSGSSNQNSAEVDSLGGQKTDKSTKSSLHNSITPTVSEPLVVTGKDLPLGAGEPDPGGAEQQTGESNSALAALAAIPLVVFVILLAYYRSKKKKKIDPALRLAAMEEVHEAMGKAKADEAEHIDLLALESKIDAAVSLQVCEEELVAAKETLTDLRQRLSNGENTQVIENPEIC